MVFSFIGFLLLSLISSFSLAYFEGKRNNFRLFGGPHYLGVASSVLSAFVTVGLWVYFQELEFELNTTLMYSLVGTRVIFALLAAKVATDKKRSLFGWFAMALIEPTFSLAAISLIPGLVRSSNMFSREIKFVNQKYIENLSTIKKLKDANLLTKGDFLKKRADLRVKYEMQMHIILENQREKMLKIEHKNLLRKLESAYSSGVLTKEEYLKKKEEMLNNTLEGQTQLSTSDE